jgi:hypothetical protein
MANPQELLQQHIDGIIAKVNMLLDKRFAQARRIQPKVQQAEADMRFHQLQVLRDLLASRKGFGPEKFHVANILASADEEKKAALFNPVDQVSMLNEIIPEEDQTGARTAGRLTVRSVSGFYSALDPSLASVLELLQTWIWWDLRDASELYRFDLQEQNLNDIKSGREYSEEDLDWYRNEMGLKPGVQIDKQEIMKFELKRAKEIIDRFAQRLTAEEGHQVIVVSQGREATPETDTAIIRLGKRLQTIETVRNQDDNLDPKIRQHYGQIFNISPEDVKAERILTHEEHIADVEREKVSEMLAGGFVMQNTANFKYLAYENILNRFETTCAGLGVTLKSNQQEAQ